MLPYDGLFRCFLPCRFILVPLGCNMTVQKAVMVPCACIVPSCRTIVSNQQNALSEQSIPTRHFVDANSYIRLTCRSHPQQPRARSRCGCIRIRDCSVHSERAPHARQMETLHVSSSRIWDKPNRTPSGYGAYYRRLLSDISPFKSNPFGLYSQSYLTRSIVTVFCRNQR